MEIETTPHGDATLVTVRGRIVDGDSAERAETELSALVASGRVKTLMDLTGVDWFDSTGIEILVGHYVSVTKQGGKVCLLGANDRVKHLFKLVRLDGCFGWVDDAEAGYSWLAR